MRCLSGILLCLGLTACGASKPTNMSIAQRSLLQTANLPAGFSPLHERLFSSTPPCTAPPYFRRAGAAVAVAGYRRGGVSVVQAIGVFKTAAAAERALTAVSSPQTEECVVHAASPTSVVIEKPQLPHLGFSAHDTRYIITYLGDYIDTVTMRVGRSAAVVSFIQKSEPAPQPLMAPVIRAARMRSSAALSQ